MESLYDDLDCFDFSKNLKSLQERNGKLEFAIKKLIVQIQTLSTTNEELTKKNKALETNISSLYKTAAAEVSRKDSTISKLRKELDEFVMRYKNKREILNNDKLRSTSRNSDDKTRYNRAVDQRKMDFSNNVKSKMKRSDREGSRSKTRWSDKQNNEVHEQDKKCSNTLVISDNLEVHIKSELKDLIGDGETPNEINHCGRSENSDEHKELKYSESEHFQEISASCGLNPSESSIKREALEYSEYLKYHSKSLFGNNREDNSKGCESSPRILTSQDPKFHETSKRLKNLEHYESLRFNRKSHYSDLKHREDSNNASNRNRRTREISPPTKKSRSDHRERASSQNKSESSRRIVSTKYSESSRHSISSRHGESSRYRKS